MKIDMNTVRLLGAAQLLVFISAVLSERLLASVVGSGSISDILVNVSKDVTQVRISSLLGLVDSLAIVILAVLFYIVFNEQYKIIALIALGFFLVEAITLAVSKTGAFALIPLSQEFVEAGAPESSHFQTLGDFLYFGQALAIWGLVAVSLLLIPALLQVYDRHSTHPIMVVGILYLPFELVLGLWLIIKGVN
jgi:hypothetical protein